MDNTDLEAFKIRKTFIIWCLHYYRVLNDNNQHAQCFTTYICDDITAYLQVLSGHTLDLNKMCFA